ncbi:hypothetical protein JW879_07875 [candidate division WOR-3 bacterium]|nr:hypothetical protein [candidate division WOR-3 bacterium]
MNSKSKKCGYFGAGKMGFVIGSLVFLFSFGVAGESGVSENWRNHFCSQICCSDCPAEMPGSGYVDYVNADSYEKERELLDFKKDERSKGLGVTRTMGWAGGVLGGATPLIFGSLLDVGGLEVLLSAAGGGFVGGAGGFLFAKVMTPVEGEKRGVKNPVAGCILGIPFGALIGAASGAAAGGLMFIGTESDSPDSFSGPGFGMFAGAIIGGAVGGLAGGVSGILISGYSNTYESERINLKNNEIELTVPTVYVYSDIFGKKDIAYGVELFNFKF